MAHRYTSACIAPLALAIFASAGLAQSSWQSQGPGPVLGAQVEGMPDQGNPVTGAVRALAPHPTDPNILYAGAVNGGVWRTFNARDPLPSWEPLTDFATSLSIGALAFDMGDDTYRTLVAGVGRFSSFASTGGAQTGVLRTTDGGATWTQLGTTQLLNRNISSIAARGVVLLVGVNAGTQPGLYRSFDAGTTCTLASGTSGLATGPVYSIGNDPISTGRFYIVVGGGNGGVFRTTDFGSSWTNVTGTITDITRIDNAKISVARSATPPVVWVSLDIGGELAGVYQSLDAGGTWNALGVPTTDEGGCPIGANPGGQGNIHMSLAGDPSNPSVVYVGGDRQPGFPCDFGGFPNSINAQDYSGRSFRGDANFPPATRWRPLTHAGTASNSSPHADSRAMAFDADGNLLESDDGGVYRRVNPNQTTGDWVSVIGTLTTGEFHSVAWDATSRIAFGGTQDCGSNEQITPGGHTWRNAFGGDGGKVAVDNSEPLTSYRYGSYQYFGALHRRMYDAENNFLGIDFIQGTVEGTNPPQTIFDLDNAQFYSPVIANRVFGPGVAVLMNTRTFVSYNRGDTFRDLGAPGGTPVCAVIGGRRAGTDNAHLVWLGLTGGRLYFRDALTNPLTRVTPYPGTPAQTVRTIATDPNDYGTLIVCETAKVFYSRSLGAGWTDVTGDLTETVIRSSAFVPDSVGGDKWLVGGNNGVFATSALDPGQWTEFAPGLPNSPVRELTYDPINNLLIAGTLGRGVWTLDLNLCPADFNRDGGVDGGDVEAFFIAWESGENVADVNRDGGVDGGDVEYFFRRWEAGGC